MAKLTNAQIGKVIRELPVDVTIRRNAECARPWYGENPSGEQAWFATLDELLRWLRPSDD